MSSKGSTTTTKSQEPPASIMQGYLESLGLARQAISRPYEQYTGQTVAGLTPTQLQGISNVNAAAGMALPYYQQGANLTQQASQGITPEMYQRFYSPYVKDVAEATQKNLLETYGQQAAAQKAGAIQAGAFGGDRSGIAAAELARQQALATGQTMSNIYQQGYTGAMGLAGQNVTNLAQTGAQLAQLGQGAQTSALQGAQAQMTAGGVQQATEQERLRSAYDQWLQYLAYPYQQAQFFANIAQGIGAGAGGTASVTQPGPNPFSQALGAIGTIGSLFTSDKRIKENIIKVGELDNGNGIYLFNYKDDPEKKTQIGFIAQDVEKHTPDAVFEGLGGIKAVDYMSAATEGNENAFGGLVAPSEGRRHFATGGVSAPGSIPGLSIEQQKSLLGIIPDPSFGPTFRSADLPDISSSELPSEEDLGSEWWKISPETTAGIKSLSNELFPDSTSSGIAGLADIYSTAPNLFLFAEGGGVKYGEPVKRKIDTNPQAYDRIGPKGEELYIDGAYIPVDDEGNVVSGDADPTVDDTSLPDAATGSASVDASGGGGGGGGLDYSNVAGISPSAYEEPRRRNLWESLLNRDFSPEARDAVLAASFALMAGKSPNLFSNLGQAGLAGLQTYYNAVAKTKEEEKEKEASETAFNEKKMTYLQSMQKNLLEQINRFRGLGQPVPPELEEQLRRIEQQLGEYYRVSGMGTETPYGTEEYTGDDTVAPEAGGGVGESGGDTTTTPPSAGTTTDATAGDYLATGSDEASRLLEEAARLRKQAEQAASYSETENAAKGLLEKAKALEDRAVAIQTMLAKPTEKFIEKKLDEMPGNLEKATALNDTLLSISELLLRTETGAFEPLKANIVSALYNAGVDIDVKKLSQATNIAALNSELSRLFFMSNMKSYLPGAISNFEIMFFGRQLPDAKLLPTANRYIVSKMKAAAQINQMILAQEDQIISNLLAEMSATGKPFDYAKYRKQLSDWKASKKEEFTQLFLDTFNNTPAEGEINWKGSPEEVRNRIATQISNKMLVPGAKYLKDGKLVTLVKRTNDLNKPEYRFEPVGEGNG